MNRTTMNRTTRTRRTISQKGIIGRFLPIFLGMLLLMILLVLGQPPSPHGIAGTIYLIDGSTQVGLGTPFTVNDSTSGDFIRDVTSVPVPGYTGRYSVSIDGNDGDLIIVRSWNASHYGENNRTLLGDMAGVDIILNRTRPPEANITILFPPDGQVFNASITSNVTANITWFGGSGSQCNTTLSIVNESIINSSPGQQKTLSIGAVTAGTSSLQVWNITAGQVSSTNLSVTADCLESGILLEANGIDHALNLTVVDTTPPLIIPYAPLNSTSTSNRTTSFVFFANDSGVGVANCSLVVNGSITVTNTSINGAMNQTLQQTFNIGSYSWQIQCYDFQGNQRITGSYLLNVTLPDLFVNASLILFPKAEFQENENITINATIANIGNVAATDAIVRFLELDPLGAYHQLGQNTTVTIPAGGSTVIMANYTTKAGTSSIIVQADIPLATNGSISEDNESNNEGNRTISISIWQIYYGDVAKDIILGAENNASLSAWYNATIISGNLYVVDSDSSVSWSSLQALSRDTGDALQMGDFPELDMTLNISYSEDSVNRTYTENGVIRNTTTYTVFDVPIFNVPSVNSTNTSSFMTGILWDQSDGNTQYNGSQDVVFVTKISPTPIQGAYGIYNYEIRVPANLRTYIQPSNSQEVSFYVELK
ncbi:MAG: hypothetical protein GXP63_05000 [DPANN group archaeon]|nr:hypothetical protein [DPANN group archaeon]